MGGTSGRVSRTASSGSASSTAFSTVPRSVPMPSSSLVFQCSFNEGAFQCSSQHSGVPRTNPLPSNGPLPSPLISDCRGFQAGTHGGATPRERI